MAKILIHACPARMWYVEEFLIPSLEEQGIEDIDLALDSTGKGNLQACLDSFAEVGQRPGGTWHLQDDVLIARNFAERIEEFDDGVACGFCHTLFEPFNRPMPGYVPALYMFNSFPCIRIPNEVAAEFIEWYYTDARYRDNYQPWVRSGIHDDGFWHDFYVEKHRHDFVWNIAPNIVEHVDWLIGGSVANEWRGYICRASYWDDPDENLIQELARKLASRKRRFFHTPTRGDSAEKHSMEVNKWKL